MSRGWNEKQRHVADGKGMVVVAQVCQEYVEKMPDDCDYGRQNNLSGCVPVKMKQPLAIALTLRQDELTPFCGLQVQIPEIYVEPPLTLV